MNGEAVVRGGTMRSAPEWLRAAWTASLVGVVALVLAGDLSGSPSGTREASDAAIALLPAVLLVLAALQLPERWLGDGLWHRLLAKWSRLVLVPLAWMAAVVGAALAPISWLPPPAAVGPLAITLGVVGLWCLLQVTLRPPRLFLMLRPAERARLAGQRLVFHLLHNGLPEEVFFRFLLQTWLVQRLDSGAAGIAGAALLFGISHLLWRGNQPLGAAVRDALFVQTPLGALLGMMWHTTGWLPGVALCHALINVSTDLNRPAAALLASRHRKVPPIPPSSLLRR